MMHLYLITRKDNDCDYDEYDSMVVCAESGDEAIAIVSSDMYNSGMLNPDGLKYQPIGNADILIEKGIVLASFNAG